MEAMVARERCRVGVGRSGGRRQASKQSSSYLKMRKAEASPMDVFVEFNAPGQSILAGLVTDTSPDWRGNDRHKD